LIDSFLAAMAHPSRERGYGKRAKPKRMLHMEVIQQEIDQKMSRPVQLVFYNYFREQIGK
jgi:hypothetical protein